MAWMTARLTAKFSENGAEAGSLCSRMSVMARSSGVAVQDLCCCPRPAVWWSTWRTKWSRVPLGDVRKALIARELVLSVVVQPNTVHLPSAVTVRGGVPMALDTCDTARVCRSSTGAILAHVGRTTSTTRPAYLRDDPENRPGAHQWSIDRCLGDRCSGGHSRGQRQ